MHLFLLLTKLKRLLKYISNLHAWTSKSRLHQDLISGCFLVYSRLQCSPESKPRLTIEKKSEKWCGSFYRKKYRVYAALKSKPIIQKNEKNHYETAKQLFAAYNWFHTNFCSRFLAVILNKLKVTKLNVFKFINTFLNIIMCILSHDSHGAD